MPNHTAPKISAAIPRKSSAESTPFPASSRAVSMKNSGSAKSVSSQFAGRVCNVVEESANEKFAACELS